MTYLGNLANTRIQFNNSRLNREDSTAYNNRKAKGAKRYDPRGNVVRRLRALERKNWCDSLKCYL